MTNTPPPDHGSSHISLDEWIGIIVAFTTIGTILVATLIPREKGFNLSQYLIGTEKKAAVEQEPSVVKPKQKLSQEEQSSDQALVLSPARSSQTSASTSPVETTTPPAETSTAEEAKSKTAAEETQAPVVPVVPTQTDSSTSTGEASVKPSPSPTVKSIQFTDVSKDSWANPYIETLANQGIMSGFPDGSFRPEDTITRAQFASVVNKAFEKEARLELPNFKDVPDDVSVLEAIQETVKTGFLRGYPDQVFRPGQPISRVQAIVALASGLDLEQTTDTSVLQIYQDASKIPNYAKEKVSSATAAGLVLNHPDPQVLDPDKSATRAEVAALVYQALVESGKAEKIPSPYIAKPPSAEDK